MVTALTRALARHGWAPTVTADPSGSVPPGATIPSGANIRSGATIPSGGTRGEPGTGRERREAGLGRGSGARGGDEGRVP